MNNRGFTLVELLATLIILGIVAGISTYAIGNIIEASRDKDYNNLIMNIKDAAEEYYLECKYSDIKDDSEINICNNYPNITLGELVNYGYLTGNKKNDDGSYSIEDPISKEDISDCKISVSYSNGKINVSIITEVDGITEGICPTYGD